jgi:hypothetical protein
MDALRASTAVALRLLMDHRRDGGDDQGER